MSAAEQQGFEAWAIVEVFGHHTFAGLVSEQSIGGCNFVRVDVPEVPEDSEEGLPKQPGFTKLFGQGAIYAITPVAEEVARAAVRRLQAKPVTVYLPELRPPAATRRALHAPELDDEPEEFDPRW
ncbi:MAG TPA: hypothetical protein VFU47_07505 [Armatimonadota bacterium]|nr:hypothetical protein [Armatimonadota bacterium]